jgi:hypothetical protein
MTQQASARCARCGKSRDEFPDDFTAGVPSYCRACHGANQKAWRTKNRDKANEMSREWYARNPEKMATIRRRWELKTKYGLTPEEFDVMLAAQEGKCRVCGTDKPMGQGQVFQVDHDHVDGHTRGLLCTKCNCGIGMFDDNPDLLIAAAMYIEANRLAREDAP